MVFAIAAASIPWRGTAADDPVVPPGELLGVEPGTPLKPGWHLFDTDAYRGTVNGDREGLNIPILTRALGDGIPALLVVLGITLGLVAPKLVHDIWRGRSARPAAPLTAAGVLDA